jgi:hypothetical protein
MSEEKLDEVLAYLLRLKSFRQYAEKTIINNVYMDLDMLCRKPQFKRTHSVIDREGIYARAQRYKKRLQPDYDRGLCLETVRCVFTLPEGEAEKYRITHDGQETRVSLREKLKHFKDAVSQDKNRERSREKNKDRGQSL